MLRNKPAGNDPKNEIIGNDKPWNYIKHIRDKK